MDNFVISCESTVDLPYDYVEKRNIPVLFYKYIIDNVEYEDDMLRNPENLENFYKFLREGKMPKTSQINEFAYYEFFENIIKNGKDILHITFGTGMTQSFTNALIAAEELKNKYPGSRIAVIDSLCSSSGYGMLVDYAADMRDEGKNFDEIAEWLKKNRNKVHHQFYSTRLDYYRRSGRMSGPVAMIGTVLNICPIMRINATGKIIAYDKVRGRQKAIRRTIDTMQQHAENGLEYSGKCFVCHSDSPDDAEETKKEVEERFPALKGKVKIFDIGTIIAAHCGPGTVAVFFLGDERKL